MKTTFNLPDDLVKEVKLRAVHEGKKLQDAVAELLRRGLEAPGGGGRTVVRVVPGLLAKRRAMTRKFVSGEWGAELAGYDDALEADRRAHRRTKARRGR